MALEEEVRTKRKKYSGYRSFQYLEPGTDYTDFKLAREIDRPTDVWPNVMCACACSAGERDERKKRVNQSNMRQFFSAR